MELLDWVVHEEDRVKSFKSWPFKRGACCPAKMAEAGFLSLGKKSEPDLAMCYVCFKELDGWEKDDDPWDEHRKHAPACAYVQLGKKPSAMTLRDIYVLETQRMKNLIYKKHEHQKQLVREAQNLVREELDTLAIRENKENRKGKSVRAPVKRTSRKN